MILYCCSDLLWATKVKSTADSLGIPCRPARNLEMLSARLADSPVKALILDLEAGPVAMELLARVRAAAAGARPESAIRVVAFGPHVEVGALREAAAAGAESVLTRGAFSARLPEILRDLDHATN
ncbi:MAG: hypothetical protein K2X32_08855 [Phycisphaerales bacterium]|nr:hypothetical protein [Phycisphaerales bacterium]